MESLFSRYKNALVLMLVLLAQIVLLAMQVRRPAPNLPDGHNVRLWRAWVSAIVTPPERLVRNIGDGTRNLWSNYIYLRHLKEQNENLADENTRLRLEQASLAEDAREGQELRRMLDFRGQYLEKTVPAQVIGTSGTDQARVIYIDKGSNDGLKAYMPVVTPDGIIGKLKNVFSSTAQVLLISDQTSGTGVMLQATRIRGVLKGNASGQPQIMNISPDERIKPGDAVVTSGGDQVYPPGLPVGVVDRVVADPESSFVNIVVKPAANLSRLDAVLVVTSLSDKMPFTQEKDLMQSEVDALPENQRAADVLSEKLPSLRDVAPTETTSTNNAEEDPTNSSAADPARPLRPPPPIHPDRYTPGAAPPAATLTPGQAPPMTHRPPTFDASEPTLATPRIARSPATTPGPASATAAGAGTPANPPRSAATNPSGSRVSTAAPWPVIAPTRTSGEKSISSTGTTPPAGSPDAKSNSKAATTASSSSGFKLPLQPADSTTKRTPVPASDGSLSTATQPKPSRPASTSLSTGGLSSDGILEPAGMGQIGSPRPRPTTPKAPVTNGSAAVQSSSQPTPKPGASTPAKPAVTKPQTPPASQPSPPGGR
jgi:rod shape-determining protein MreC